MPKHVRGQLPEPDLPLNWSVPRYVLEFKVLFDRLRLLWPIAIEPLSAKDRDRMIEKIELCMRYYRGGSMLYEEQGPTQFAMHFFEFGYKTLAWIVYFLDGYLYARGVIHD